MLAALLCAVCVWSALPAPAASPAPLVPVNGGSNTEAARTDIQLYRAISRRVSDGESYYSATAWEHRQAGYPVVPMQAIRLPTLAWLHLALGETGSRIFLMLLATFATLAWWRKLGGRMADPPLSAFLGGSLVAFGLAAALHPSTVYSHEAWAGTLIALSLGLHRKGLSGLAILTGAAALMLRELALPFVLLMGAVALWNRRWTELGGWLLAIGVFLVALWFHAQAHAEIALAGDRASPGWLTLLGMAGFTGKVKAASILGVLPSWAIGPAAILAIAGWLAWRDEVGLVGAALHGGYAVFFCLFGRPDNYYWGFVSMPTLLLGFLVLPSLWRDFMSRFARTP